MVNVPLYRDATEYQLVAGQSNPEEYTLEESKPVDSFEDLRLNFRSKNYSDILKAISFILLPTYLQWYFLPKHKQHWTPQRLSKTSWIDGVRGVAALVVSVYHYCQPRMNFWTRPFFLGPYSEDDGWAVDWTNPLQLPIIRIFFSGVAMVPIFFVISGYVLSYTKVISIRKENYEKLSNQMFSSIVRRGFRLFPPVFVIFAIMQFENHFVEFLEEPTPNVMSYFRQFFMRSMEALSATFKIDVQTTDLLQFWTIPIEFSNSMILFVVGMGVSKMNTKTRILSISVIAIFALFNKYWGVCLFLTGWVMAEAEAIWQERDDEEKSFSYHVTWITVFVIGLFLASFPIDRVDRDVFLWWLPHITPKIYADEGYLSIWYFWTTLAAPMVVWPMFRLPRIQGLFTTRVAVYLGEISYALYAVHYRIYWVHRDWIKVVGDSVFGLPSNNMLIRTLGIVFELIIYEFIIFWQADLFWRFVDKPTVKFAQWVEKKLRAT